MELNIFGYIFYFICTQFKSIIINAALTFYHHPSILYYQPSGGGGKCSNASVVHMRNQRKAIKGRFLRLNTILKNHD